MSVILKYLHDVLLGLAQRIKISLTKCCPSHLKEHLTILRPFLAGIRIRENGPTADGIEIDMPDHLLSDGYKIVYVRRSIVIGKFTDGSGNSLHVSEQTTFKTNHIMDDVINHPVFDIFYENESINQSLEEEDWKPEKIAAQIEQLLKFTDTMRNDIQ